METFNLTMSAVQIHVSLYTVVALPSTRIRFNHISPQKHVRSSIAT